jgi:hypothetical protein
MIGSLRKFLLIAVLVVPAAVGYALLTPSGGEADQLFLLCNDLKGDKVSFITDTFPGGCILDDKIVVFKEFTANLSAATLTSIDTTPLNPGFTLTFDPALTVANGANLAASAEFTVTVKPGGHKIDDVLVSVAGSKVDPSTLSGVGLINGKVLPFVEFGPPLCKLGDCLEVNFAATDVVVLTGDFAVTTGVGGSTTLNAVSFNFSEVGSIIPEPAPFALVGTGLLALAFFRKGARIRLRR